MSELNFMSFFTILSEYTPSMTFKDLYLKLFYSSYGKDNVDDTYISKIKSGERNIDRNTIKFYVNSQNRNELIIDIYEVLAAVSDKFGVCRELRDLILADSMEDKDKNLLLSRYPENENDIAEFLADVFVFSLTRPKKDKRSSPIMSERINLSAVTSCKYFCGRKNELQTLSEMLETHDKIFIYGVGGIGKSEFVKKFIKDSKSDFTNILYLTYSESLKNTIAGISFKGDDPEETMENLYTSHMNYLRVMKSDTLVVIDNFDIFPYDDDNFNDIAELDCKILFTTRSHLDDEFDVLKLPDMDKQSLFEIAEKLNVTDIDKDTLDNIFEALHNHTLACELILRLLKKSAFTPDELLEKIRNEHVNLDVSDKIRKDKSATYYEHIHQLFRLFSLTEEQKAIMRLLSLIPVAGIDDGYFKDLTKIQNMNVINELDEIGLVTYSEHLITVHPLIGEAAAADLIPDMVNSREFMENLISEYRHHIPDEINELRQVTILEIADRIIEFTQKNDIEYYFGFLINACPYAETFEDKVRMEHYISEMEKYLDDITDRFSKAIYCMCKAAYTMLFEKDSSVALDYTKKAQRYIPEVVGGGFYSPREIEICFNVNNNIGRFYHECGDVRNAHKYYKRALDIYRSCKKYIPTAASLSLTLNMRKLRETAATINSLLLEIKDN